MPIAFLPSSVATSSSLEASLPCVRNTPILGKTLFVTCSASYKNSDFVSDPLYSYNVTNKHEVNYHLQP